MIFYCNKYFCLSNNGTATALYDSSFPRPFTLLNNVPIARINIGKILKCCRIPIKTAKNTIGNNAVKKNETSPLLTRPPNTKTIPASAYPRSAPNPSEIPFTKYNQLAYLIRNKIMLAE